MTNAPLVSAQQSNRTLRQAWSDANGFVSFGWLRAEDGGEIYSSAVYVEVKQNTLNIYNTYKLDPFGKNARCGGLGCDLGKGQVVGTLNFEPQGSQFIVRNASGQASFLKGARCRVAEGYVKVLECTSTQNPASRAGMSSIFRFTPGT
ncbi:hypothetical protein IQ250_02850 [Pseudanabaenaceae cyanobacterium LEGE 13415]|nr:hypothetical protein [Pseudanabaenaceae cyanobacterium LEGE 13415]